jgi:hypothetical protein
MDDQTYVYGTLGLTCAYFAARVFRRTFDPFEPIWVFLVGYLQLYVIQAIFYRDWALRVRGLELVTAANARALWVLAWFLVVYHSGIARRVASRLPRPPARWSTPLVLGLSPVLILWGLLCAGILFRGGGEDDLATMSAEGLLIRSFSFVMLVAAILLIVTGRHAERPAIRWVGIGVAALYVVLWMFNGKRSHSLFGVLSSVCALYVSRGKRPSWPVLITTAFAGALVVAVAIGWRIQKEHDRTFSGFTEFVSDFDVSRILVSLNMKEDDRGVSKFVSHETEEYGGFLLMMDTVPVKSDYDYGANYLRCVSTFVPRILWPDKPLFGREQWVNAWIAGSELKRDSTFTSPAIGILGAAHLNGGAIGTAIVLACAALLFRASYDYFNIHAGVPWVQVWWCTYFVNAWFMVVGDDPLNWFYYNWGFTSMPLLALLWLANKLGTPGLPAPCPLNAGA